MKLFKILYDSPGESYFAGQVVTGKVLIVLNRPKKIKALKLRCIGRGEVDWTERSGKNVFQHQAVEPYFNFDVNLVGEESGDIILPIGENTFPFRIQLPCGIPSSFQATHGKIQYFILAKLSRPWKFSQKISSYFTVNGFVDLNLFGTNAHPITVTKVENDQNLGCLECFCWYSSSVGFVLTMDKTGFVPGDAVRFSLQIKNKSSSKISSVLLTLIQMSSFKARNRQKFESRPVQELRGPRVGAKETKIWDSDSSGSVFKIPAVPPTNLGGGTIISVQYYLSVTLKLSTVFEKTITGRVLLIIGTVPYRNLFEQLMPQRILPITQEPQQPTESSLNPPATSFYPTSPTPTTDFTSPPPTYAEAMELYNRYGNSRLPSPSAPLQDFTDFDDENSIFNEENDEAGDGRPFSPRYATYEWNRNNSN